MKVKDEIRKVFRFLQQKEQGQDEHGNNGYVVLSGHKYFVGKMSYDKWYIEPYYKGRKETDTFSDKSLWENFDMIEILQLFADNNLIEIKVK
jgi:hypothetical protein